MKNTSYPLFRETSVEDFSQIAALEARYGLTKRNYDQWIRLWTGNPAYRLVQDRWPIGWVLENDKKQIVGSMGNIPLLYEFGSKNIAAATGRAWVVDTQYRGYALRLIQPFLQQDLAELYFNTTPSFEAARAFTELGARRVPVGTWDRRSFWITNCESFLSRWLAANSRFMPFMSRALSHYGGKLLSFRQTIAEMALRHIGANDLGLDLRTDFDDRFDTFWEELKFENSHLLLAVRTREVLDWHFAPAREQNRLWIWIVTERQKLIAYCTCLKLEDHRSGISRVSLVDFQALKHKRASLLAIVSAALDKCKQEGIDMLENPGLSFAETGITEVAPYNRPLGWWTYFYKARDKKLADALTSPHVWAPSRYDGDASIL